MQGEGQVPEGGVRGGIEEGGRQAGPVKWLSSSLGSAAGVEGREGTLPSCFLPQMPLECEGPILAPSIHPIPSLVLSLCSPAPGNHTHLWIHHPALPVVSDELYRNTSQPS